MAKAILFYNLTFEILFELLKSNPFRAFDQFLGGIPLIFLTLVCFYFNTHKLSKYTVFVSEMTKIVLSSPQNQNRK